MTSPTRASAGAQAGAPALLDVPYVAQTPALCGGAAVAMVLRYWGVRDIFPEDFASLVGPGGIRTGALTDAVVSRGWQAHVLPPAATTPTAVRAELNQGRPLMALIEVSPGTYHYVVVVGTTVDAVVLHDPAIAPFRVLRWAEFDRAWAAAGRWMLRVLPTTRPGTADTTRPVPPRISQTDGRADDHPDIRTDVPTGIRSLVHTDALTTGVPAPPPTPCVALVERSVRVALDGDTAGAERGLLAAAALCPQDAAPTRELAGLRFSQRRWADASTLAQAAVRLAPADAYAWELLAASRHLTGDATGALAAWNHGGEPRVDLVTVRGAGRTRHPAVVGALGLEPRTLLTPERYTRALRRLRALPAASGAQLRVDAPDGGLTRVEAFIDERPDVPRGWLPLGALGARAVVQREVVVDVPGGLGVGERAQVQWRWATERPRVSVGLALPGPGVLPGILTLEGAWERQAYAHPAAAVQPVRREERRRVAVTLSDWITHRLRGQAGVALDGWRAIDEGGPPQSLPSREHLALHGGLDARLAGDRVAFGASGGWWWPLAGQRRFSTISLLAAWRSTPEASVATWAVTTGFEAASRASPFGLWSGAGTGQARDGLLRAHPLLHDGVLDGPAFGRVVPHASLAYVHPWQRTRLPGLALAGFVDVARAWQRQPGVGSSRAYVDAGIGLRLRAPGTGGAVRIDLAQGLRGGGTVLSAGWDAAWPR